MLEKKDYGRMFKKLLCRDEDDIKASFKKWHFKHRNS